MTSVMRASVIASIAVATILLAGEASAGSGADLRRIVIFHQGTPPSVQQRVIADSGSRLLRALPLINAASIVLPATDPTAALTFLTTHPAVAAVRTDPRFQVHGQLIAQGAGSDGAGSDGAGSDGAGSDGAGSDQPVVFVTPALEPPKETYPWGIDRIGAADVHDDRLRLLGDGVKVAVFDTGIDRRHPDLAANIVGGLNAIDPLAPDDYDDDNGHGTAMAGIIAARLNRRGVVGAAPHAQLYAVKVLDKKGQGHTSDVIYALGEIAERPDIRVISMSFGTSCVWPEFKDAIQVVTRLGKIIVASRGNAGPPTGDPTQCPPSSSPTSSASGAGSDGAGSDGAGSDGAGSDGAGSDGAGSDSGFSLTTVKYPAAYPETIAVGATIAHKNKVASYSMLGVDLVAPGGDEAVPILTTNRGGGYGLITGTSPAAAHVSGAVALALQLRPHLSPAQVQALLMITADHLDCPRFPNVAGCPYDQQGAGLVDVRAIVEQLTR